MSVYKFKKGDTVRVIKLAQGDSRTGIGVGFTGTVLDNDIYPWVDFHDKRVTRYCTAIGGTRAHIMDQNNLELVEKEKPMGQQLKVESCKYDIKIIGDKVVVGCQTITKDDALKIAEFIQNSKFEERIYFTREEAIRIMKATGCKMTNRFYDKPVETYCQYAPSSECSNLDGFALFNSKGYVAPVVSAMDRSDGYFVVKD